MRGRCVLGHVVRESFRKSPGRSSRIRHRNALTERARKDAGQGLGKGKTIVNTCRCCLKRISLYFCFEKESDDEMETDQTEEGNQPFVAHVPVPSQKEVGFIIAKLTSFSDIENIL